MNDLSGTIIGGYALQKRIGSGGLGVVYQAAESATGREVALKLINRQFANQPGFFQHFEKIAQITAHLEHPHIVPLYSYWRNATETCLVSRLLRGGNLRQSLQNGAFSVQRAAQFLHQSAAALQAAHRKDVIHGDLKPENILFDEDDNAYVTDFTLALTISLEALSDIRSNADPGATSSEYLSPEQLRGEPATPASDIYSLGILLYEALAGEYPFPKTSRDQRQNDPLPLVTTLAPEIADAVNKVLQKATAIDPALRYADALAFSEAFREAARLNRAESKDSVVESLTPREQEILRQIVQGKSNQEIAQELYLAPTTVRWYNRQIFRKLRVHSRVQAIIRARELQLMERPAQAAEDTTSVVTASVFEPENPYKGLLAFQPADSRDFFGRERLLQQVLERMAEVKPNRGDGSTTHAAEASSARILMIIGPSGSGKSSFVKAGLIPALWRGDLLMPEHWSVIDIVPGSHPLDSLETALTQITAGHIDGLRELLERDRSGLVRAAQSVLPNDGSELVVVIDQFEEVFTLVRDEAARAHFLALLVAAVTDPRSRVRIVITLRADFYDRPLRYPEFSELILARMVTILPLTADEMERAIAHPAEQAGVSFEPGLVASIIADVNYQPGALPLLQFTLTELFNHRTDRLLTRDAYEGIGGVIGALTKQADVIYQALSREGQEAARQMFLRLVTLGEGTEDTRRRVPMSELAAITPDGELLEELLDTYVSARLLSLDHDPMTGAPTVEIAHEALIQGWEQFREWLKENREELHVQRQLMTAAEEWIDAQRDPGFLASGVRLEHFEWVARRGRIALSEDERAYLSACIGERVRRETEREAQQRRVLRLQRSIIVGLVVFSLTAVALLIFAFLSRNQALSQTRIALSRQLAAQSLAELRNPVGNDEYAALLAIRSLRDEYDSVADGALVEAAFKLPQRAFIGHSGVVYDVKFSPDGRYILTGSGDQTARLWDAATGEVVRTFSGDGGEVYAVAFSSDGTYIATGNEDHTVKLWDTATGQQIRTFTGHEAEVESVAFSPDDKYLLTRSLYDGSARLWDVSTGQQLRSFTNDGARGVAFSPDGQWMLVSDIDSTATLWETSTGHLARTFRGHANSVYSVAFSPDGKYIVTGSIDNTAKLWDAATGREIYTFRGHSASVRAVAFSPDGRYVATGSSDHTIRLWDAATGQELRRFSAHLERIWSIAFSPDGRTLVSASADHTVKLWNVVTDDEMGTFSVPNTEIFDVAFSPNGAYALTASADNTARLWDVATGTVTHSLKGHTNIVYSAAFSPDGVYALTGSADATAILWDVASGQQVRTFAGHQDMVLGVAFSPDGVYALTGSADTTAILWDVASGQQVRTFAGHQASVTGVSFSPDGSYILTTGDDGTVKQWETASGQEMQTFTVGDTIVYDADFSPDGKTVLIGSADSSVGLWDVATGRQIRSYLGESNSVYNVAFSPDGNYVAAASADRTATIWNTTTEAVVRVLRGHRDAVWGVAFSPDGRLMLTGSLDHTADLWQTDYHDFVASVCGRLLRDFTDQERELASIADDTPTCPQFAQSASDLSGSD
ncbi:MAG: protein kinase [Anaerolineae bacterium]